MIRGQELNELEKIEIAKYPIIMAPFHGAPVPVMLMQLTQAQIMSCGEFSLIETFQDKINRKKLKISEILDYSERNAAICRRAMVKPTYDQVMERISYGVPDKVRNELNELEEKIKTMKKGPKLTLLKKEIDSLRAWVNFLLPEDFTAFIVSYTLGIEKSDIKEITENTLIKAAILAERGKNNPADHIQGAFTAFMRDDINQRAWILLDEKRKENKRHGC